VVPSNPISVDTEQIAFRYRSIFEKLEDLAAFCLFYAFSRISFGSCPCDATLTIRPTGSRWQCNIQWLAARARRQ
jgi:hypothetical protein